MIRTIGHSTRPLEELARKLASAGVTMLVDVRTVPRSRHNPQFNRETLPEALAAGGVSYRHDPGWAACARRARTRSTSRGATPASAASPTTCRLPSSSSAWTR